jgi:hypothetical protein
MAGASDEEPAPVLILLQVLRLVQLEVLAVDREADGKGVLLALVVEVKLRHHRPQNVPGVHHERGAGVHGGPAALLAAEVRGLPSDRDVLDVDLSGAVVHHVSPREFRGHAVLVGRAEGELSTANLVLRAGPQVEPEEVHAGLALAQEGAQDVELLRVRAARGQADDAVELELAEGFI